MLSLVATPLHPSGKPLRLHIRWLVNSPAQSGRRESGQSASTIVDSAFKDGVNDFTSAVDQIIGLPSTDVGPYLNALSDGNQAAGITAVIEAGQETSFLNEARSSNQLRLDSSPSGNGSQVTPAAPSNSTQPSDSLNDPMASFFANFSRNTVLALGAGYARTATTTSTMKVLQQLNIVWILDSSTR